MGIIKRVKRLTDRAKHYQSKEEREYALYAGIQKGRKATSGYVEGRDEPTYDFSAVCVKCGAEYPVEHVKTFMGRCADCAEKKINLGREEFKQSAIKTAIACVIILLLDMLLSSLLIAIRSKVGEIGSVVGAVTDLADTRPYDFFVTMAQVILFVIGVSLVKRRFASIRPIFVYIIVGAVVFVLLALNEVVLWVAFTGLSVWFIVSTVKRFRMENDTLVKFKYDTVAFRSKVLSIEEAKAAGGEQNSSVPTAESTGEGEVLAPTPTAKSTGEGEVLAPTPTAKSTGNIKAYILGSSGIVQTAKPPKSTETAPDDAEPSYYDI